MHLVAEDLRVQGKMSIEEMIALVGNEIDLQETIALRHGTGAKQVQNVRSTKVQGNAGENDRKAKAMGVDLLGEEV